jgi:hypothetical protein
MSSIQLKLTNYERSGERSNSIEINPEMIDMGELAGRNFKTAIISWMWWFT